MSDQYGGIYRLPPAPQRSRPTAILPDEVFPDPPIGNIGRGIVMAIVAAQWIWVPPPVQRAPVVTEEAAAEVRYTRVVQHATIRASWETVPQPQRALPSAAILPADVGDNPPVETRRRVTMLERVVDAWRPGPPPQPPLPTVLPSTLAGDVIITLTGDTWNDPLTLSMKQDIIDGFDAINDPVNGWNNEVRDKAPASVVARTSDTVATVSFPIAPAYDIHSGNETITHTVPASAVAGASAVVATPTFDVLGDYLPPDSNRKDLQNRIFAQWIWTPEPQRLHPRVTESAVVAEEHIPRTDRQNLESVRRAWEPRPVSQRGKPSATLPADVGDNPPVETRRSAELYARVAAIWTPDPEPYQRPPRHILPAAAFPDPPVGAQARIYGNVILASWRVTPEPQQRAPRVTEGTAAVDIPFTRERVVRSLWEPGPGPQQRLARAILPAQVFDDPPLGQQRRVITGDVITAQWVVVPEPHQRPPTVTEETIIVYVPPTQREQHRVIVEAWQTVPAPQRQRPSAILPAEVFDNPPLGDQARRALTPHVSNAWLTVPQPQRTQPKVTAEGEAFVPRTDPVNGRIIRGSWEADPAPHRALRNATLPDQVFDNPPVETRRATERAELIVATWAPNVQPQRHRTVATEGTPLVAFTRERIVERLWAVEAQPQRSTPTVVEEVAVFVPRIESAHLRIIVESWATIPAPQRLLPSAILPAAVFDDPPLGQQRRQLIYVLLDHWLLPPMPPRSVPVVTAGVIIPDICGPLFSALVDPLRESALVDPLRESALVDPARKSDLECG